MGWLPLEDGRLILEKWEAMRRRLKDRFARPSDGQEPRVLIAAERRREAEAGEGGAQRFGAARLSTRGAGKRDHRAHVG